MLLNCGVGEDSWESLGLQGNQTVHPKGNQSWIFIRRTDVEAETPRLRPPDVRSWLIWKDPDAERDWEQEEKGATQDEMVGWHHRLNGHGFGWTPAVGDGQEVLACLQFMRSQRVRHDWATQLNWMTAGIRGNHRQWLTTTQIHYLVVLEVRGVKQVSLKLKQNVCKAGFFWRL